MGESTSAPLTSTSKNSFHLSPLANTFLLLASVAGLIASLGLLKTEIEYLSDPTAALNCDISILVGCSSSLTSWEAHLFFGLPNTALGIAFFAVTLFVSVTSYLKVHLPRQVWHLLAAASGASLLFIGFFLYASIFNFQALCPYCLVIWAATFITFGTLNTYALSICKIPLVNSWGKPLHKNAWAVVATLFLLTAITVLLGLTDKIATLL
ncbi:hypothetical protein NXS08_05375 [Gleimia sp. 6138-11-ORH1]|uniref:vitamin K epoxide reductase family protein n=1 Tax=Gleimia sp. 6138-11-ORH1 TaxID=2973937 RepID=UPI002168C8BE|nr:vitamin K epoxide reductase family protein [Gleimia sp. 6138-11-ORH1]MCS4484905.1 hypothetical protein [Gleimia sp. 6138-11-ORH1]